MNRRRAPLIGLVLLLAFLAAGCRAGGEPGTVKVVRNGGPFDNKKVKEVICPSQGRHYIGMNSTTHSYPAFGVQRYFKITTDPGQGADLSGVIKAKSADGFNIHVSGTFEFQTVFNCTDDDPASEGFCKNKDARPLPNGLEPETLALRHGCSLLVDFDRQFGVRKYPDPKGGEDKAPWQGSRGWDAFLNAQALPLIQNTFRRSMLKYTCEELVASCTLVASRGGQVTIDKAKAKTTGVNLAKVQESVAAAFAAELLDTFGQRYFVSIKFLMGQPELDPEIEKAINTSLAAFAQVSQAQAGVQTANQQAEAAKKLGAAYRANPALVELEKWRIICGTKAGDNTTGGCSNITVVTGLGGQSPIINAGKGK